MPPSQQSPECQSERPPSSIPSSYEELYREVTELRQQNAASQAERQRYAVAAAYVMNTISRSSSTESIPSIGPGFEILSRRSILAIAAVDSVVSRPFYIDSEALGTALQEVHTVNPTECPSLNSLWWYRGVWQSQKNARKDKLSDPSKSNADSAKKGRGRIVKGENVNMPWLCDLRSVACDGHFVSEVIAKAHSVWNGWFTDPIAPLLVPWGDVPDASQNGSSTLCTCRLLGLQIPKVLKVITRDIRICGLELESDGIVLGNVFDLVRSTGKASTIYNI